jgi:hypothetical protein
MPTNPPSDHQTPVAIAQIPAEAISAIVMLLALPKQTFNDLTPRWGVVLDEPF